MFKEAFKKLELKDVITILDKVNPEFDGVIFDPIETIIMTFEFPFYPNFIFLDIADYSVISPVQRFVLYSDDKFYVLNFTNELIYQLNKEIPICLNKEIITDYVRFFFTYVSGQHGRFLITESVDDINWREEPLLTIRKAVGKMLIPTNLKNIEENGDYKLQTTMIFKDLLFKTNICITKTGFIYLINEEPLIEDMPILDDIFKQ